MEVSTSVLIVGGSLNGLTAALLLARRGVRCLGVERHPPDIPSVPVPRHLSPIHGDLPPRRHRSRHPRPRSD
jgi:2-polyprenyl-6-methoxyphenol hydroxylase-like FAD-dependent oxidoreductase